MLHCRFDEFRAHPFVLVLGLVLVLGCFGSNDLAQAGSQPSALNVGRRAATRFNSSTKAATRNLAAYRVSQHERQLLEVRCAFTAIALTHACANMVQAKVAQLRKTVPDSMSPAPSSCSARYSAIRHESG